jgi:hypothetical protein
VKLDGRILPQQDPPDGVNNAIRSLDARVRTHGKRFLGGAI